MSILYNGYKDKADRVCYYCHTAYAERHEVYGGPNRQVSIREGFQVDLCQDCHRAIHGVATEEWRERKLLWQQFYQREKEEELRCTGLTPGQARKEWLMLIGRNYL